MFLEEKNLISLLKNFKCFENQPRIAVGVSGGPDSMALAYLLSKWIKKNKGKLYCIIFDHNIRSNSKHEAYQVKDMLKNLKIETHEIPIGKTQVEAIKIIDKDNFWISSEAEFMGSPYLYKISL